MSGICIDWWEPPDEFDLLDLGFSYAEIEALLALRDHHQAAPERAARSNRLQFLRYLVEKGHVTDGL